jgi:hypothetical protein
MYATKRAIRHATEADASPARIAVAAYQHYVLPALAKLAPPPRSPRSP